MLVAMDGVAAHSRTKLITRPDADGSFRFEGLQPGRWLLRLDSFNSSEILGDLDVAPGARVDLGLLDLERLRPGLIEGVCSVPQGTPPRLVNVRSHHGMAFDVPLTAEGRFTLRAPAGTYVLGVNLTDEAGDAIVVWDTPGVVVEAGTTVETVLHATLQRLRIRLVDAVSGEPVSGACLSIDEERATRLFQQVTTDSAGEATLYPCPTGSFDLSIQDGRTRQWRRLTRVLGTSVNPLVISVAR